MLTISKARAFLCDLPVASTRTDAMQAFLKQETVFVEIETADGASGLGKPTGALHDVVASTLSPAGRTEP